MGVTELASGYRNARRGQNIILDSPRSLSEGWMAFFWSFLRWALIPFLGFPVFTQTVLRVVKRFDPVPTPAFFTRLIDNPMRRRFVHGPEVVSDRVRLGLDVVVLEIGPGKGSYTLAMAQIAVPPSTSTRAWQRARDASSSPRRTA